jgi:hypothetical protein
MLISQYPIRLIFVNPYNKPLTISRSWLRQALPLHTYPLIKVAQQPGVKNENPWKNADHRYAEK